MKFSPTRRLAALALALPLLLVSPAGVPASSGSAFPALTLTGLDGGYAAVSDFKGQPVLINFWATWCGPCRMELPVIQRFYDKYNGRGLVVLAVSTDAQKSVVPPFLQKMKLSLPIYGTTVDDQARLGVASIPTTFLVDGNGNIVRSQAGYSHRFESEWGALIEKLLPAQTR